MAMAIDPYRLVQMDGTPEQVTDKLRDLDAEGWQLLTILPYRPDQSQQLIVWEPWAVLRRVRTSEDA